MTETIKLSEIAKLKLTEKVEKLLKITVYEIDGFNSSPSGVINDLIAQIEDTIKKIECLEKTRNNITFKKAQINYQAANIKAVEEWENFSEAQKIGNKILESKCIELIKEHERNAQVAKDILAPFLANIKKVEKLRPKKKLLSKRLNELNSIRESNNSRKNLKKEREYTNSQKDNNRVESSKTKVESSSLEDRQYTNEIILSLIEQSHQELTTYLRQLQKDMNITTLEQEETESHIKKMDSQALTVVKEGELPTGINILVSKFVEMRKLESLNSQIKLEDEIHQILEDQILLMEKLIEYHTHNLQASAAKTEPE